jgi:emp24/gp25L/p24 family/GOLD
VQPDEGHLAIPTHAICTLTAASSAPLTSHAINAEATNARVAWFSIGSLFVCIFLAAWQLWYLKVGDIVLQCSLCITLFTQKLSLGNTSCFVTQCACCMQRFFSKKKLL